MADAHHCWGSSPDDHQFDPADCHCEIGTDHGHDDWLVERPHLRRVPREMCEPVSATPGSDT